MVHKAEHPSKVSRSLAPTGEGAKPPATGPAPESQVPPERDVVKQAERDVEAGLKDTSRRGQPDDLPGARHDAAHTPGAQVPEGGLSRTGTGMRDND